MSVRVHDFNKIANIEMLQRGLGFRKNKNSFGVVFLHYTADADKDPKTTRGRKWLREAVEGMDPLSWSKEMEMDFFAKAGQAIFPQFENIHIIPPFKIPKEWTIYQGVDGGIRAPCAGLWAAVDPFNSIYLCMEYEVSGENAATHALNFKKLEKKNDLKVRERVCDPTLFNRSATDGKSIADIFESHGISMDPSVNEPLPAINIIYEWLAINAFTKAPRLYVFSNLYNTIRELTEYHWEQVSSLVLAARRNPAEMPEKVNDHLINCLQYLAHADIRYIEPRREYREMEREGEEDILLPPDLMREVYKSRMYNRYG